MNNYAKLSVFGLSLLISIVLVPSVAADETPTTIEVSGNGASSQNNVSVNDTNTTSVQQSNTAEVTNTIETNAETGENAVDHNAGGNQNIATGDVSTSTSVTNEANQSTVQVACCENTTSSITVANNGAGSENTVSNTSKTQTSITTINSAKIVNNFTINANTGRNKVNYNTGGDTTVKTGDITINNNIVNGPINANKVTVVKGNKELKSVFKIAGNGAFSENIITESVEDVTRIKQDNFVNIFNNVEALMNTGENEMKYNTDCNVFMITGDIIAETVIKNLANVNIVEMVCAECKKEKQKEKEKEKPVQPEKPGENAPNQPEKPTTTTSVGGVSGSSSANNSSAASQILPITGTNLLFFLLLANIMMFFLGTYLRLRSGRSPGYSFSL